MTYAIDFTPAAERDVEDLPADMRPAVGRSIAALAGDPRPPGSGRLTGTLKGSRRLRVGDYRVGYQIDEQTRAVTIWQVKHRSKFYDKARRRRR